MLKTPEGGTLTDRSFPGKWLLVYFGYTFCPDACPTALNALGNALDELGPIAAKVQPIFITVDPERDTPQVIADYVKAFDPSIVGLSGTPEQIAAAAKEFRVYYEVRPLGNDEYAIDHSSFMYVINSQCQVVELLTGQHTSLVQLESSIERNLVIPHGGTRFFQVVAGLLDLLRSRACL